MRKRPEPTHRIESVRVTGPTEIEIGWEDGGTTGINLAGWIAQGSEHIAPLKDPNIFKTARVGEYGHHVEWEGGEYLAIDLFHLKMIASGELKY